MAKPKPCNCIVRTGVAEDTEVLTWTYDRSCGGITLREFVIGHDAKLKSELIKAFRANADLRIVELDSSVTETSPLAVAVSRGWEHFMTAAPTKKAKVVDPATDADPLVPEDVAVEDVEVTASATPPEPTATEDVPQPSTPASSASSANRRNRRSRAA